MAFLGFLVGTVLVIILRALQGLDTVWEPGVGLIMATFTTAYAFLWGIGAFNPAMSEHPHEPEVDPETGAIVAVEEHHEEEAEGAEDDAAPPIRVLGYSIWQVSFWTIVMLLVLAAMATLPTPFPLQISSDPAATPERVGYFVTELPFLGEVVMSQLTLFVILVVLTLLSLAVIGGFFGLVFTYIARGLAVSQAGEGAAAPAEQRLPANLRLLGRIALFLGITVVLYVLFYVVLIGLVIPAEPVRTLLSLGNALIFAALIVFTAAVVGFLTSAAGWLARMLRALPRVLQ
jgi:hypothetical protein